MTVLTIAGRVTRRMLPAVLLLGACALGGVSGAWAQSYPTRAVTLVVPYPPGGGTDITARFMAQKLAEAWGQPVVVENRSGAAATLGAGAVAKAAPDGYRIILVTNAHAITGALYGSLPYDAVKDFAPIGLVASYAFALAVNPELPVRTTSELVALVKSRPSEFTYASAGVGSVGHLTMEVFKKETGLTMLHVPYRGSVPALVDVSAGRVSMIFDPLSTLLPQAQAGRLRALAVSTGKRSLLAPDLPTVAESSGARDFNVTNWLGLLAPANTPPAVVNRINAEVVKLLSTPDAQKRIQTIGYEPWVSTPAEFSELLTKEVERYRDLIKSIGLKDPGLPE